MLNAVITRKEDIKYREDTGKVYFTIDDLNRLPEWPESPLLELINGELYVVPSPTIQHQRVSRNLEYHICRFLEQHDLGELFDAPVDVVLSKENVVIPDLVFVSKENKHIITEKNIRGVPDLIVEILSASTKKRDLIDKKELYEQFGVKEYLILDPERKEAILYQRDDETGKYGNPMRLTMESALQLKTIPNFEVPLSSIF